MTGEDDEGASVPPLGDGFASAGTRVPSPDVNPSSDLPGDVAQAVAYAYPSLNLVEFHVDTAPGELGEVSALDVGDAERKALVRLLYTQVKALREELLHGTRSELGVARNVRLVDRQVHALVEELAAIGASETAGEPGAIVESLIELVTLRSSLQAAQEESVETVDKFHVDSLLTQEDEVLEDLLERLAPHEVFAADVRTLLEEQRSEEKREHANKERYEALIEMRDRASWRLAEATARAAADVPFLVSEVIPAARELGVDIEAFETVPVDSLQETLGRRLDVALEVAETATADVREDAPTKALVAPIRAAVDEREGHAGGERSPADLSLPLLDVPARGGGDEFHGGSETDVRALRETETTAGYFLAGAFRTVGDFGAALYLTPDGEWQWAINPWTLNVEVDVAMSTHNYDRLWCHNYLSHSLAKQIAAGEHDRLKCPLCYRSPSGKCGVDGCGFADRREEVERALSHGR